jgi:Phospholipase_D-nuclease N-terminal
MHQGGIRLVKLILEIALAVVLHPVAVVLSWINIKGRTDLSTLQKILWAVISVVWGIGPILYILFGGGTLW